MFYVVLLYALFASVFTVSKTALDHAQPFFLIGSRMVGAGLLLLVYQIWATRKFFSFSKQTWVCILKLAFFNIYLTNAFEFWGLQYVPSFKACFIYSLSPFLSALFCFFLFGEKLKKRKWIGLLVGFIGFLPILFVQTGLKAGVDGLFAFSLADIALVMAAVCSVYGWISLMQLVNEHQLSPLTANGLSMLLGGGIALCHSLAVENWHPIPVTQFSVFFECTLFLILISNLICYNLYGYLLKRYSATFLSFAGLTTPLFSAFYGYMFLNETISWPFYCSFAIVLIGLFLFDQEELKQGVSIPEKSLEPIIYPS